MAKQKAPKFKKDKDDGGMSNWVRTGGAVGGSAMEEQRRFNEDEGAGVDESVTDLGPDPNDAVKIGQLPGAEE